MKNLTLTALVTALSLTVASPTFAEDPHKWLNKRRAENPPLPTLMVSSCPMDDEKFWSHWATEKGYEHILSGDMENAAKCYDKAAEMYRKGVAAEHRDDCSVCDTYHQFATLLKELPKGAINLHKETFEESAKKALKKGDRKLASQLYELTAIGWSRMEIEGTYGRFGTSTRGGPLHRVNRSWQDGHLKAGNFYEVAAKLTSSKKEEKRLLQKARDVTAGILDTHYCSSDYKLCKDAEKIVERLEFELR